MRERACERGLSAERGRLVCFSVWAVRERIQEVQVSIFKQLG